MGSNVSYIYVLQLNVTPLALLVKVSCITWTFELKAGRSVRTLRLKFLVVDHAIVDSLIRNVVRSCIWVVVCRAQATLCHTVHGLVSAKIIAETHKDAVHLGHHGLSITVRHVLDLRSPN